MVSRSRDRWIIDLPLGGLIGEAALWEAPFKHLNTAVDESGLTLKELRGKHGDASADRWWEQWRPRSGMKSLISGLSRYIVTPETAEHRVFAWLSYPILPDKNLIVVPRADDTTFGVLQSHFHELWVTAIGNRIGAGNQRRYNNLTCFETFPFPGGLTPDIPATNYADDPRAIAIATAAARLNELRENWLNPNDLVRREPEVVTGYPYRILPVNPEAAKVLQKRTLTNLYNERPAWLDHAHKALDAAVAAAYGWTADLSDEEVLARLFALNQERATATGHDHKPAIAAELKKVD